LNFEETVIDRMNLSVSLQSAILPKEKLASQQLIGSILSRAEEDSSSQASRGSFVERIDCRDSGD